MSRRSAQHQRLQAEQVQYAKQCLFWTRSLDRNDADMAAVVQLNRQLSQLRSYIVKSTSEMVLLDLGDGTLRLAPDGRDVLMKVVTGQNKKDELVPIVGPETMEENDNNNNGSLLVLNKDQQDVCVDFLLRQKLRRKLISRILRRLNRIACSMDGEKEVAAPTAPRYGELRFSLTDDRLLEQHAARYALQQAALKQVQRNWDQTHHSKWFQTKDNVVTSEPDETVAVKNETMEEEADATTTAQEPKPEEMTKQEGSDQEVPKEEAEAPKKEEAPKQEATEPPTEPEEPKPSQPGSKAEAKPKAEPPTTEASPPEQQQPSDVQPEASTSQPQPELEASKSVTEPTDEEKEAPTAAPTCYDILRDYKSEYERVLDTPTVRESKKYKLLKQPPVDDYTLLNGRPGVGASQHFTAKKMELEHKRWKASLYSRIPEQPSYADLGLLHRVFFLEERRAAASKKDNNSDNKVDKDESKTAESDDTAAVVVDDSKMDVEATDEEPTAAKDVAPPAKKEDTSESKEAKSTEQEVDDDMMDIDDEQTKSEADKQSEQEIDEESKKVESKDEGSDLESKDNEKKTDDAKETADSDKTLEDDDKEKTANEIVVVPKIVRPISLAPIPSFHEQDMKRIKMVHVDLMSDSHQNHATDRLKVVVNDYNTVFRNARTLLERRAHLQNQTNTLLHEIRNQEHHWKNEYAVQVSVARKRWMASKRQFDQNKLNQLLPSRSNRQSRGTPCIQRYRSRPHQMGLFDQVGAALGDVVDAVDGIAQGRVRNQHFSEPFVPPPAPAGADSERLKKIKALHEKATLDMNTLTSRFQGIEEERKRCWKKLLKLKAEFNIPHEHRKDQWVKVTSDNYNNVPLPHIQQNSMQRVPPGERASSSDVPVYTPAYKPPSKPESTGFLASKVQALVNGQL